MTDPVASRWLELFMETLSPHAGLPVLLSGGMDSATLLWGSVEMGHRPHCYSFQIMGRQSPDVKSAKTVASHLGCPWTLIELDPSLDVLLKETPRVISLIGTPRKTAVQCSYPIAAIARRMVLDGWSRAIVGTGAIVLDDKRVSIMYRRSEEEAREYRRMKLNDKNDPTCGTGCMHVISRKLGVELVEPYSEEPLVSYATILHRKLVELLRDRGARLDRTYQLNVGGNMDFYNMLEKGRLSDKKISKTSAVTDIATHLEPGDIHIGPSDFVPWLEDHKVAYIRLEATSFGELPIDIEVRMCVTDSANSAGMVIDAVRAAVAVERLGDPQAAWGISPWFMKAPPFGSSSDEEAMAVAEEFNLRAT